MCLLSSDHTTNHIGNEVKNEKRTHRYDIYRPRSGSEHKYRSRKGLSIMMLICVKQHLSNIWSSIHEKIKQH